MLELVELISDLLVDFLPEPSRFIQLCRQSRVEVCMQIQIFMEQNFCGPNRMQITDPALIPVS